MPTSTCASSQRLWWRDSSEMMVFSLGRMQPNKVINHLLDGLIVVLRVDTVRGAKLLGNLELLGIRVNRVDGLGTRHLAPINDCKTDSA